GDVSRSPTDGNHGFCTYGRCQGKPCFGFRRIRRVCGRPIRSGRLRPVLQPTKNLSPTALLRINKQEQKRQQGVQDYEGEGPTRSHGLQKNHLSQGEEKEIVRSHENSFVSLRAPTQRRKRTCVRSRLHAGE